MMWNVWNGVDSIFELLRIGFQAKHISNWCLFTLCSIHLEFIVWTMYVRVHTCACKRVCVKCQPVVHRWGHYTRKICMPSNYRELLPLLHLSGEELLIETMPKVEKPNTCWSIWFRCTANHLHYTFQSCCIPTLKACWSPTPSLKRATSIVTQQIAVAARTCSHK